MQEQALRCWLLAAGAMQDDVTLAHHILARRRVSFRSRRAEGSKSCTAHGPDWMHCLVQMTGILFKMELHAALLRTTCMRGKATLCACVVSDFMLQVPLLFC